MQAPIRLNNVRQNNLKNITVEIPARKITVITGVSGSGKSSLAFDTLYAEGSRRFIESLSTYTRQFLEKMPKPDVDSVENIPPAIALEQRNHVINSRSTVGTQTEILDYLRLFFAKIGKTYCLNCGGSVNKISSQNILEWAQTWVVGKKILVLAPLLAPLKLDVSASFFQILKEQGFTRIFLEGKIFNLEDLTPKELKKLATQGGDLQVILDRLKISSQADLKETRTRLLDSIHQAITLGKGKMSFYDLGTKEKKSFDSAFACIQCGRVHPLPEPHLFSFNNPLGACPKCSGFGFTLDLDETRVVPEPTRTLKNGAIDPFSKPSLADWQEELFRFAEKHGISIGKRYSELTPAQKKLLWEGDPKDKSFMGILQCFEELKKQKYKLHIRVFIRRYQTQNLCPHCHGARIKPEALGVKIGGKNFAEISSCTLEQMLEWFGNLKQTVQEKQATTEIFSQVLRRLEFLNEVGVGYLTLSRLTKTLSGGEFQRISLATQLGNGLCGTLYVLDEPSIGLHPADTQKLLKILHTLRDLGNTVVVVEHDLEVMRNADHLIELGPAAGRKGGELIATGTAKELMDSATSLTGKYLSKALVIKRTTPMKPKSAHSLKLTGCRENNLKNITVEFPLHRFVVVSGVSGSGKSTLIHQILYSTLSRIFDQSKLKSGTFDRLYGAEHIGGVLLLDQTPIGKSSRSNPATYLKTWDEFRRLFANQVLSLRRGYSAQHFSFNVDGGRCPVCKGEGEVTLDMHFMAEMKLPCEECDGMRFRKNILEITCRGKNIFQILQTTIDEAFEIFRDNPILVRKLGILRNVGLGYLQLGQSSTTLSGGESQRLKIASALDQEQKQNILYLFDEPTTGLHSEDIKKLLGVMQDLIETNHSIIMIEHNLDVIAQADWAIELGPQGGEKGGELVAQCPPQKLLEIPESATGQMLKAQGYEFPHLDMRRMGFAIGLSEST